MNTTYKDYMLSTKDNPFNPFEDFDNWLLFDLEKGYNSCEFLARIAKVSNQFTEQEKIDEVERAIDEIIKYDFTHNYIKVEANVEEE